MKGLGYNGPRAVSVTKGVELRLERPTDFLVKITTTKVCGSDLHEYEGRASVEKGKVLGHEDLGVVIAVGEATDCSKAGDRICLPFNIARGFCKNCERRLIGFCLTVNPGSAGAAYGDADMGPYNGGHAGSLRVSCGDFNRTGCLSAFR